MDVLEKAARAVGLSHLPPNLPTFLASFAFFTSIHLVVAPWGSRWLSPETYRKLSRKQKNNWCVHIVSVFHVLAIVPLAVRTLQLKELAEDKAFGWSDEKIGTLTAVASGYFLWDTLDAIINFIDIGFVFHGLACLAIYVGSFKPFLAYYAARCLLWETSTFFLNIHWFLDKTNRTGSKFQLINGVCLLLTFFVVRLVYGGLYVSTSFAHTMYEVREQVPSIYIAIYVGGNILLNGLNVFWFVKMIKAVTSRFSDDAKEGQVDVQSVPTRRSKVNGQAKVNGF